MVIRQIGIFEAVDQNSLQDHRNSSQVGSSRELFEDEEACIARKWKFGERFLFRTILQSGSLGAQTRGVCALRQEARLRAPAGKLLVRTITFFAGQRRAIIPLPCVIKANAFQVLNHTSFRVARAYGSCKLKRDLAVL
jgi:hypothetical protein